MDTGNHESVSPSRKKAGRSIGVVFLAFACAGAGFYAGRISTPSEKSPTPLEAAHSEDLDFPAEAPLSDEELATLTAAPYRTGTEKLTVQFPEADSREEFLFEARSSVFNLYGDKYGYELRGIIKPQATAIEFMTGTAELIAEGDRVALEKRFTIIPSYRHVALPGDSIPFRLLIFEKQAPPPLTSVRIRLREFKSTPFEGTLAPGKVIPLGSDEMTLPPGFSLELNERSIKKTEGGIAAENTARLHLEFTLTNNGQRKISSLQLKITLLDEKGTPLSQVHSSPTVGKWSTRLPGEIDAVHSILPSLLPGERRSLRAILYVPDVSPEQIDRYRISLLKIE